MSGDNSSRAVCEKKGTPQTITSRVTRNADVNMESEDGTTPLHLAIENDDLKRVEMLLNHNADINAQESSGNTPLYHSIYKRRPTIVKLLLQHGADVNTVCSNQWTALTIAVTRKDITMIEDVLKYRPDVNLPGNRMALKHAIQIPSHENGREIVKKFLEYGFTCNRKESNDPEIVRSLVENGYLEMAEDIFKYIDDINSVDFGKGKNSSLLHIAIRNKDSEMTKALIKHGADVNITNRRGKPVIFDAVEMCDVQSLDLLLGNGINVKDYPNLLTHAVKTGNMEIVESLVQHGLGLDINAKNELGLTALHDAARRPLNESGDIILSRSPEFNSAMGKVAKILLNNGANVNDRCNNGRTALHIAALKETIAVVEVLLEYGADVNLRDGEGMTPLHCCAGNKKTDICEILLSKGADASARRTDGKTVLHLASQINGINVIKMLLNYVPKTSSGVIQDEESSPSASDQCYREIDKTTLNSFVDIDSRDNDGRTALDIAANDGKHAIVELLLRHGAADTLKIVEDLPPLH